MSEQAGTENTGFTPDQPAAPAGPRQFSADELAEARRQLIEQGELNPVERRDDIAADQEDLGTQVLASGAEAADVDVSQLLATIQTMQRRMDKLEAEKKLSNAPDVVKYATALFDHLTAKSAAHPVLAADPSNFGPGLDQAAALKDSAVAAGESGQAGSLEADAGKLGQWVARQARRLPQLDLGYIAELAEEVGGAAAELAA